MSEETLELSGERLDGADFSGRRLKRYTAIACEFRSCSFRGTRFAQACFGGGTTSSTYVACDFDKSRITALAPGVARFERCTFRDCVIQDFFGLTTEFVGCVFSGKIRKAVFNGAIPAQEHLTLGRQKNEFRANDFSACQLVDVGFRGGIDLSDQVLPTGPSYLYLPRAAEALARARQDVIGWRDLELRRKALAIVQGFEMDVSAGQEQLFIDAGSVAPSLRTAMDELQKLLRGQSE